MYRPFARPDSPRRFRASVEELEVRAQPARLTFTAAVPALLQFEARTSFFALVRFGSDFSLPAQANFHAHLAVALHVPVGNPPTDPPTTPPAAPSNPEPTPNPVPAQPRATAPGSGPSAPSSGNTAAPSPAVFAFTASNAAPVPTNESAASSSFALASVLRPGGTSPGVTAGASDPFLPPDGTLPEVTAIATAARATDGPAAVPVERAGGTGLAALAPIPYLGELPAAGRPDLSGTVMATTAFDRASPLSVGEKPVPPAGPSEAVAEFVAVVPHALPLVVSDDAPADPAAALAAPEPAPEEGVPWAWAVTVAGVVAGASWVLHRHWQKPAPRPDREWQTHLLGLDFERM